MAGERPRPLVAGNWKMHGSRDSVQVLDAIKRGYKPALAAHTELLVCPPATLILTFAIAVEGSGIAIGGQDSHSQPSGAYTGNISGDMLADLGAS